MKTFRNQQNHNREQQNNTRNQEKHGKPPGTSKTTTGNSKTTQGTRKTLKTSRNQKNYNRDQPNNTLYQENVLSNSTLEGDTGDMQGGETGCFGTKWWISQCAADRVGGGKEISNGSKDAASEERCSLLK